MPDRWIEGLKTVEEDGETKYRVSLDYPEIYAVHGQRRVGRRGAASCSSRTRTRAATANVRVLEEAIRVRNEIATLLGYDSWAAYVVEKRMAKTRDAVDDFLRELAAEGGGEGPRRPRAARRGEAASTSATRHVEIWDWWFYTHQLLQERLRRR